MSINIGPRNEMSTHARIAFSGSILSSVALSVAGNYAIGALKLSNAPNGHYLRNRKDVRPPDHGLNLS